MDRDTPNSIHPYTIRAREPDPSSSNESHYHGRHMIIRSLQLLISLSLFSLFVSYMTGISFLYSYTYYFFSTFLLPAVTRALERKYMFLLCNSLVLVFILGFHGSIRHDHPEFDEILASKVDEEPYAVPRPVVDDEEEEKAEEDVGLAETETEVPEEEDREEDDEEKEDEEGKKEVDDGGEGDNLRGEVDREVVTVGCTDEELNKKFDEFIRKMKEELRLEAQEYQLIAA